MKRERVPDSYRCEYVDGRGRCRDWGPNYHFSFLSPTDTPGRALWASTEWRRLCLTHFRKVRSA